MILGDFNIHWDSPFDRDILSITEIMAQHGFSQSVTNPMHSSGHSIDLMFFNIYLSILDALPLPWTDHFFQFGLVATSHGNRKTSAPMHKPWPVSRISQDSLLIILENMVPTFAGPLDSEIQVFDNWVRFTVVQLAPPSREGGRTKTSSLWFTKPLREAKKPVRKPKESGVKKFPIL